MKYDSIFDSRLTQPYNDNKLLLGEGMMPIDSLIVKQELMSQIDQLPDDKLREVLDFVEFLLLKEQSLPKQPGSKPQAEALNALNLIRETVQRTYGVYQGDLLAEAREEREQDLTHGLGQ